MYIRLEGKETWFLDTYFMLRPTVASLPLPHCSRFFACSTDVAPPTFKPGCPSNIFKDADRTSTSTVVNWESVRAEDNSGGVPNITHFGRLSGSRFPEGEHQIKYIAVDSSNNIAECIFRVIVKGETDQNVDINTNNLNTNSSRPSFSSHSLYFCTVCTCKWLNILRQGKYLWFHMHVQMCIWPWVERLG